MGAWTANEWRTRARSFESISLYGDGQRILIENGESEVLRGLRVNHEFFETLGVNMLLGRSFLAERRRLAARRCRDSQSCDSGSAALEAIRTSSDAFSNSARSRIE